MIFRYLPRLASILGLALLASACATLDDPPFNAEPLRMAFQEPVDQIEARAQAGEEAAIYALSFLNLQGLRGVPADEDRAMALRARLGPLTQSMPITQYIPNPGGGAGTTNIIWTNVPRQGAVDVRRLDACALTTLALMMDVGPIICGGRETFIALAALAAPITREHVLNAAGAVRAETAESCEETPPSWRAAVFAMERDEYDRARTLTDRIIELCGVSDAAMRPRVMRAMIALEDQDPALARDLLAPVSHLSGVSTGSHGAFLEMAALTALGDVAGWRAARNALSAASAAAIVAEARAAGRPVHERIWSGGALYAVDRPGAEVPGIQRLMTIVWTPPVEGDAAPVGFQVTRHIDQSGEINPYFVDAFSCTYRATVEMLVDEQTPSADRVLDIVQSFIDQSADEGAFVSMTVDHRRRAYQCRWPSQTAPGLGDDLSSASSTALP